ncbi:preprotein translocase subunit SecE [Flavobacterium sp.]|jgi:preprotein translocase subunit SecE|uniref:preprotein translocase subunit SecE n=1 Tax=Flavobacterium sp. TaxID=239 RepID=UPI003F696605
MTKVVNYITESFEELKSNVTWTNWAELQKLTIVVAIFSILFALLTFGVDSAFEVIVKNIYTLLKS